MNVTKNDVAIIERALFEAISNSSDYAEIEQFQSVLDKFKGATSSAQQDGFRYDYDDSTSI